MHQGSSSWKSVVSTHRQFSKEPFFKQYLLALWYLQPGDKNTFAPLSFVETMKNVKIYTVWKTWNCILHQHGDFQRPISSLKLGMVCKMRKMDKWRQKEQVAGVTVISFKKKKQPVKKSSNDLAQEIGDSSVPSASLKMISVEDWTSRSHS